MASRARKPKTAADLERELARLRQCYASGEITQATFTKCEQELLEARQRAQRGLQP